MSIPSKTDAEWSYWLDVTKLEPERPIKLEIAPSDESRKDLARRLRVREINRLFAKLAVSREPGSILVNVAGDLEAQVTQDCVVTLEPIRQDIRETIDAWYADPAEVVSFSKARREKLAKLSGTELEVLDEKDDPDEIVDGQIDIGELVTQFLSLAIDPYPHKEGV
jgi:uncharacterized metal-binding protein YceD (DUF177 family)